MIRPIRWACLALALSLAVMGDFLAGPPGPGGLRLGLPGAGSAQAAELQVEAPRFTFDQASNIYTYEDGRLTLGGLSLFASRMELNASTGKIHASGFIRVETPTVSGIAESLELDATTRVGTLRNASLYVNQSQLYLRAEEVVIYPSGRLQLRHCSLTSCPPDTPGAWSLDATTMDLNPDDLGVAWNPRLFLGPVPVLWLPGIAWPTVQERRSGLLRPEVEHDTSSLERYDLGWRLRLPIFLNLGYSHDLTLTPEPIQKRGTALGLEYDYAFWNQQMGRLRLWGLREREPRDPLQENDILTPNGLTPPNEPLRRYRTDWLHNETLGDATRLILTYHDTSDGQLRHEYDRVTEYRPYRTYQASLAAQWPWADAALTYEQNADYLQESVYGISDAYTDQGLRPQLLPRFTGRAGNRLFDAVPLTLELGLGATRFQARQDLSGSLYEASPTLSLPLSLGGSFELRPSVTRHFVSYSDLTQFNAAGPATLVVPVSYAQNEGTLELRMALARVYLPEEGRYAALKHILTPRLIFTGVEDVSQPFADSLLRTRVAEQLATLRLDSVLLGRARSEPASAARAAAAASDASSDTSLGAAATPAGPVSELLRVNLIQRYNLLLRRDASPLQGPVPDRTQETQPGEPLLPLLLELTATGAQFTASALLNYHHQLGRSTEQVLSLQGSTAPSTNLAVGYSTNEFAFSTPDNKLVAAGESFTFGGATALGGPWTLGFSGRINLNAGTPPLERRLDHGELFVDYHPICYAVRANYKEEVVAAATAGAPTFYVNRSFVITFDLAGFVGGPAQFPPGAPAAPSSTAANNAPPRAQCHS